MPQLTRPTRPIIEVYLSREDDAWMADFVGDSETLELFGTTVLPTPFRATAAAATVVGKLAARNPDCDVFAR